jgi:hypothetical protein
MACGWLPLSTSSPCAYNSPIPPYTAASGTALLPSSVQRARWRSTRTARHSCRYATVRLFPVTFGFGPRSRSARGRSKEPLSVCTSTWRAHSRVRCEVPRHRSARAVGECRCAPSSPGVARIKGLNSQYQSVVISRGDTSSTAVNMGRLTLEHARSCSACSIRPCYARSG